MASRRQRTAAVTQYRRMRKSLVITVSSLHTLGECPAQWHFGHREAEVKGRTDYPRLAGIHIHRHLQQEERPTAKPRRFYYQTLAGSLNAWKRRWREAALAATATLLDVSVAEQERYLEVGQRCITLYRKEYEGTRPLAVEDPYRVEIYPHVMLWGRVDQIRPVSMEWIARWRPDLIRDGALDPGYEPVVIWDAKTGFTSPDARVRWPNGPTPEDWAYHQFPLHHDIQFTLYTFLFKMRHGKLPVGCIQYHAQTGTEFPTFRDERDFGDLFVTLRDFLRRLEAGIFPKRYGEHCSRCDYMRACQGERPFLVVRPGHAGEEQGHTEFVPNLVKREPDPQRSFRFPVRSLGRMPPPAEPITPFPPEEPVPVLRFPIDWDEGEKFSPHVVRRRNRNAEPLLV